MKYIKCIKDTELLTAGKWYGIDKLNNFYITIVTVFRPSDNDWVMSDKENFDLGFLSEHNPDLENEIQPITKENILKVLHNNGYNESTLEAYCELLIRNSTTYYGSVMLNNVLDWLGTVESITGKLKPLPKLEEIELKVGDLVEFKEVSPQTIKGINYTDQEVYFDNNYFLEFKVLNNGRIKSVNGKSGIYKIPEFNFERYLIDNGFKVEQGQHGVVLRSYVSIYKSELITDGKWSCGGVVIQGTPQNADTLIALAKLAEGLK